MIKRGYDVVSSKFIVQKSKLLGAFHKVRLTPGGNGSRKSQKIGYLSLFSIKTAHTGKGLKIPIFAGRPLWVAPQIFLSFSSLFINSK